ncbi:MAG: LysR family transcriptional regulator [Steroidobacteraceae bacterium]
MESLDDFFYFAKVVEHGGYAAAGRALAIPKSRLSRHVSQLETRLNVRLVNRSTRRFAVSDIGREVYRHATAMLGEAEAAVAAVEFAQAEPRGIVKLSCPVSLAQNPWPRCCRSSLPATPPSGCSSMPATGAWTS